MPPTASFSIWSTLRAIVTWLSLGRCSLTYLTYTLVLRFHPSKTHMGFAICDSARCYRGRFSPLCRSRLTSLALYSREGPTISILSAQLGTSLISLYAALHMCQFSTQYPPDFRPLVHRCATLRLNGLQIGWRCLYVHIPCSKSCNLEVWHGYLVQPRFIRLSMKSIESPRNTAYVMQESETKDCHYRYCTQPQFAHVEGGPWGNASAVQEWLGRLITRQGEGSSLGLGQPLADSDSAVGVENGHDDHATPMEWQPPSTGMLLSRIRKVPVRQLHWHTHVV